MNPDSEDLVFAENAASAGLFKFRPYQTADDIDYTHSLLRGELYFATCQQMNDPFEMRMQLVFDKDKKRRRQRLMKVFIEPQKQAGVPVKDRIRLANQQVNQLEREPDAILYSAQEKNYERMQSECVVFCMSANREHPLLWSHYANRHRGLCVRLDHSASPFRFAHKVKYTKKFPETVYPFADEYSEEVFRNCILTKAEYWNYEDEFRLWSVRMGNPSWHMGYKWINERKVQIETSAIKGVTFGAWMPSEQRQDVIEICREYCPHVEFDEAIILNDRYELAFSELSDSV